MLCVVCRTPACFNEVSEFVQSCLAASGAKGKGKKRPSGEQATQGTSLKKKVAAKAS